MALSTKDAAAALETTPRTLRKFLRSEGSGVGQGSRYSFNKQDVTRMKKRFIAWNEAHSRPAADEVEAPEAEAPETTDEEVTLSDEG